MTEEDMALYLANFTHNVALNCNANRISIVPILMLHGLYPEVAWDRISQKTDR